MSDLFTDRSQGEPRVDLHAWYATSPLGQRLRQQLTRDMKVILDGWFGFNLVVIGPDSGIAVEEMTRVRRVVQLLEGQEHPGARRLGVFADDDLPLATESVDVVVVMHGLDMSHNPHQLLREINRVLTPHGHLLVVGNNRWSLLGVWRQLLSLLPGRRKRAVREPGAGRLQDWLTLLDFAVAPVRHKLVLPLSGNNRFGRWLARVDDWLVEHNIPLGSSYIVFADKLVRGNIRTQSIEKTRARLMGLRVPKPVVGARGSASRSHLRSVE